MKKIVCLLIAVLLLIPVIPTFAAGDTTANAANAYFKVGNGYYSTLKSALEDAPSSADKTIYLLKDASISESELKIPEGVNITVDLKGYTLTNTYTSKYLMTSVKGTLTVKNGNLNVIKGIVVQGGGHLIIDNVKYTVNNTSSNARPAVKLNGAGETKLTAIDSYIKTVGPGESLVLVEQGTDGFINLEGNTTLEYGGVLDDAAQNCAAIAVQAATTNLTLNMGAKAKIVNTAPAIDNPDYAASAIVLETSGNITLNLEKGATIAIDREGGQSKSYHINTLSKNYPDITVNDKGANWLVSAKTLSSGTMCFTSYWAKGNRVIGWTDGEKIIKPDEAYTVENATFDVSYKPICFSVDNFYLLDGASIRADEDVPGIRFSTVVSDEITSYVGKEIELGTLIAEDTVNPNRSKNNKYRITATKFVPYEDGSSMYHAAIYIEDDCFDGVLYDVLYSAVSYMTVTYYNGETDTYYTEFSYNNMRSMKDVAKNLDVDGYKHDFIDYIFTFFDRDEAKPQNSSALLVGYCTEMSLYNGAFNSTVGWVGAGMGYIIRTKDGKIIAIDGGNTEDAYGFYYLLREYCQTEKVVVDYWILTHPHSDHVGALVAMTENRELADKLEIKNLVFHFPTDYDKDTGSKKYNEKMHAIAQKYGSNVIYPTEGLTMFAGSAKITFYLVITDYKELSTANKFSLIFSVETDKKVMFTGDIYEAGMKEATEKYGDALKSDILQMPHHFLMDTGYQPFYEAVDASTVMLPTCIAGYNAMYNDPSYKNSANHKENDWAAKNADTVYKAFEGTFEIEI